MNNTNNLFKLKNLILEIRPDLSNEQLDLNLEQLDSFDVIALVALIEDNFKIKIAGTEIIPENFYSTAAIICLIESKLSK